MLYTTIDFLTLIWALALIVWLPVVSYKSGRTTGVLLTLSVGLYLVAQSSYTTAFLANYGLGKELANYIWFVFNGSVLLVYTMWAWGAHNGRR